MGSPMEKAHNNIVQGQSLIQRGTWLRDVATKETDAKEKKRLLSNADSCQKRGLKLRNDGFNDYSKLKGLVKGKPARSSVTLTDRTGTHTWTLGQPMNSADRVPASAAQHTRLAGEK